MKREARFQEYQRKPADYEQKVLDLARVARVTAGGRRFSFRAVVVIGDRAGQVGVGVKKGKDVQFAVEKAVRNAKKGLTKVPINELGTIPHESYGKFSSSVVFLKPAAEGRGIIAGGAVRAVCDLAGYSSIVGKIISRSGNKLNVARAAIIALKKIKNKPSSKGQVEGELSIKKDASASTEKTEERKEA